MEDLAVELAHHLSNTVDYGRRDLWLVPLETANVRLVEADPLRQSSLHEGIMQRYPVRLKVR